MATRRARDSKGRFKKKKRSTRKGQVRKTARRAYTKRRKNARSARGTHQTSRTLTHRRKKSPARSRTRRRNQPAQLGSIAVWAGIATLVGQYGKKMIGQWTAAPNAATYGSIATVGAIGWWLTNKAKTKPAGYALIGIAMGQLASDLMNKWMPAPEVVPTVPVGVGTVAGANGLPATNSEGAFTSLGNIYDPLPSKVSVPGINPVANIVVPG